jgi:regulator of protease activity HflC (stomatin/prohibitin superfamily)
VQSVEIRDVRIPQALENAMSQQAQAERERQARIILGDAEVQVSEQFAEASRVYNDNPGALHLRGMNMLYEAIREKGAMVLVPSSAIETMGLGGTLALHTRRTTSNSMAIGRSGLSQAAVGSTATMVSFCSAPSLKR